MPNPRCLAYGEVVLIGSTGGAVFPIFRELQIPIKLIGVGERAEDLHEFDRGEFVEALF